MKILLFAFVIFVLAFSGISFGQSIYSPDLYLSTFSELYLNRQPSARSEAMGRTGAASSDGDFGAYYNPALTSFNPGLTFNSSFSSPYYRALSSPFLPYIDSSKFNYFGVTYSNPKVGSFSLSRYFWTLGSDLIITDETGSEIGRGKFTHSIYSLNYSREVFKDLFAGINVSLNHIENPYDTVNSPITIDIGLLKKFSLEKLSGKNSKHFLQFGIAAYNITSSKFNFKYPVGDNVLPVIARAGVNYIFKLKGGSIVPGGDILQASTNVEFQSVVNSSEYKILKFGEELIISNIVALRFGYFTNKLNGEGSNYSSQSQFTYGAGLNVPLHSIFSLKQPLSLKVDYVNMKPPEFSDILGKLENFSTFAFSLNWQPGY